MLWVSYGNSECRRRRVRLFADVRWDYERNGMVTIMSWRFSGEFNDMQWRSKPMWLPRQASPPNFAPFRIYGGWCLPSWCPLKRRRHSQQPLSPKNLADTDAKASRRRNGLEFKKTKSPYSQNFGEYLGIHENLCFTCNIAQQTALLRSTNEMTHRIRMSGKKITLNVLPIKSIYH